MTKCAIVVPTNLLSYMASFFCHRYHDPLVVFLLQTPAKRLSEYTGQCLRGTAGQTWSHVAGGEGIPG